MSDMLVRQPAMRKQTIELSHDEQAQLNSIIDLLIPSDEKFPPPSTLHLIDEFLHHLVPTRANKTVFTLNEPRLRSVLRDLNYAAGGSFREASPVIQNTILRQLERRDPAVFQALWTLANHSYYTHLATMRQPVRNS